MHDIVDWNLGDGADDHHEVSIVATEVPGEAHGEGQLGVVHIVLGLQRDRVVGVRLEHQAGVGGREGDHLQRDIKIAFL